MCEILDMSHEFITFNYILINNRSTEKKSSFNIKKPASSLSWIVLIKIFGKVNSSSSALNYFKFVAITLFYFIVTIWRIFDAIGWAPPRPLRSPPVATICLSELCKLIISWRSLELIPSSMGCLHFGPTPCKIKK